MTSPEYFDHLETCLSRIPHGAHLWLGGDFNLPDIDWSDECPKPQASNLGQCKRLLDIVKNANLEQIVNEPTRITEFTTNILDLFFTNNAT